MRWTIACSDCATSGAVALIGTADFQWDNQCDRCGAYDTLLTVRSAPWILPEGCALTLPRVVRLGSDVLKTLPRHHPRACTCVRAACVLGSDVLKKPAKNSGLRVRARAAVRALTTVSD
jgi:hypothetical protein